MSDTIELKMEYRHGDHPPQASATVRARLTPKQIVVVGVVGEIKQHYKATILLPATPAKPYRFYRHNGREVGYNGHGSRWRFVEGELERIAP